ncbi:uncharacterized protein LOC130715979 [Lotus japonicus]|uniref:uncharacterized protein LOC130715979 n=1 Tax=Lotus japonicus TaxID=34305 RepID=UPI0025828016|nr:uncharacterized protein LOC130715979 [Lotus japonicus]
MEVEVAMPMVVGDFNFDSNCSSPYITAPSSPQRLGNLFFSAPTSPTRGSPFFHQSIPSSSSVSSVSPVSSVPFNWEQKPVVPNKPDSNNDGDEFEFNFNGSLERASLSAADELFSGGKIRPLKPPPRIQFSDGPTSPATQSPGKKALSHQKRDSDPFESAIEETHRGREAEGEKRGRGTEKASSSGGRKGTRSLSPLRVSDIVCEESEDNDVSSTASNGRSFLSFTKGYRKWRIRDFLLFRSASEGRATDKEALRKYEVLPRKSAATAAEEDVRNCSFRSTESSGSVSKRRGPVSAHELHYTLNRAAAEEMKRRTQLPYKQGLFGCLGSNHGMHQISRGIGSFTRS